MCDKCGHTMTDEALRSLFYLTLKKVLNTKLVAPIAGAITDGVEKVVDGSNSMYTHGDKDIWRKSAVYFVASAVYDKFLYEKMQEWKLNAPAALGICPCELIRDLYLIVILQIYSIVMHGFKIYPLITDIASIIGAGQAQKLIDFITPEKKQVVLVSAPLAASAPPVLNAKSNEDQISGMKKL